MVMNFNVELFCENLRATKPPYECPVDGCGKIYKSYAGIQSHLLNFEHENSDSGLSPNSQQPYSPGRHSSTSIHGTPSGTNISALGHLSSHEVNDVDGALWVEVDLGGSTYKINVHEPLVLLNDDTSEKSDEHTERSNCVSKDSSHKADSSCAFIQNLKLPEAHFKVLDDYIQPTEVPPKPSNYYRFIEKTQEELDDEVEYDLDEEDFVWLELMNERRTKDNVPPVSKDVLELLLDRFEKHCFFEVKTLRRLPRDEDAICSVCLDGECHINNVILFCDLCNLAVHQECYGVPHIPEGSWICRRCLLSPSNPVECCLCPNKRGAFKQTEDGSWAHVICALWIPEVGFANGVFLEPIDGIERIAAARWKLVCYICRQRGKGACIQCHKTSCYTAFHVTCAQQAGLYMKSEPIRDTSLNGTTLSVRKTAFCDMHSPMHSESASMALSSSEEDKESSCSSLLPAEARAKSRLKLRKARKALAESRSSSPVLAVPVISPNSIKEITEKVSFQSKNEFIRRLCSYWSLKRQSKNGVPLLRTSMSSLHILSNRGAQQQLHSPHSTGSSGNKSKVGNAENADMTLEEQFKYCKKLRQQLEKVRLLNELVRKREKLKQEHMRLHQQVLELQLSPFNTLLSQTLDLLEEKNTENSVKRLSVTDTSENNIGYAAMLDFAEMRHKISHHRYLTVDEMSSDFDDLISNYLKLHSTDSQQLKAGTGLKEQALAIFRSATHAAQQVGFDGKTGLHLSSGGPHHMTFQPSSSTNSEDVAMTDCTLKNAAVDAAETEKIQMPILSQVVNDSHSTNTLELNAPRPMPRPTGINRRSAVLHSRKARQSALRLLDTPQQTSEKAEGKTVGAESVVVSETNSIKDAKVENPEEHLSSVQLDEKGNQNQTLKSSVTTSSPRPMGKCSVLSKDVTEKSSEDDKNFLENGEDLPSSSVVHNCEVTQNVIQNEKKDKPRGRKRKKSEAEMISSSEKDSANGDDGADGEEGSEGHRQYATRRKKLHSSESDDVVIPLEPLDLVWAKCTGFPWYPALVIDPKMSKSAAFHNSVPLPIPPPDVLNLRKKYSQPMFLVSFFDAKRTWQWLPREKLDPLGVDSGLDNVKLSENKKPSMRQAVRTAYQKAIKHRCQVTGELLPSSSNGVL